MSQPARRATSRRLAPAAAVTWRSSMVSSTSTAASYPTSTASRLQTSLQMPHLMHSSWSIVCGCFFSPAMASCGQRLAQSVQPLQRSASMLKLISALHTPAGQRFSSTCASYSSRK